MSFWPFFVIVIREALRRFRMAEASSSALPAAGARAACVAAARYGTNADYEASKTGQ